MKKIINKYGVHLLFLISIFMIITGIDNMIFGEIEQRKYYFFFIWLILAYFFKKAENNKNITSSESDSDSN